MNIDHINWEETHEFLHQKGFAVLSQIWSSEECQQMIRLYSQPQHFRKTIVMERYRFGIGEYKYFNYPLPDHIGQLREKLYQHLYKVANAWHEALGLQTKYPPTHQEFIELCHISQQHLATPLILKYGKGGYNTLHQDLYGDVYFPLQAVVFLNEPGTDYTGGEFVLTEQIPRAQSKAIVLQPKQGDVLIFTTQFRPQKGSKGYYRIHMKHGVSEVHAGRRHTLGIIFHDAT